MHVSYRCLTSMFTRLGELEKSQGRMGVSFLYTHPSSEQRVRVSNDDFDVVIYFLMRYRLALVARGDAA